MSVGYSPKPLVEKLGLKPAMTVALLNPPVGYMQHLHPLPEPIVIQRELSGEADFIQFFATTLDGLKNLFPIFKRNLKQNGMLWISWEKAKLGKPARLNENMIRDLGLKNGLVDVKVVAVDEEWSGLKFVYRLADRQPAISANEVTPPPLPVKSSER